MKKLKSIIYKNFKIDCFYNQETDMFSASSNIGYSNNKFDSKLKNFCHGYPTPTEAIDDVKKQIDNFLEQAPKTYKELADCLNKYLVLDNIHDKGYVDEDILKHLVNQFLIANGHKDF